MTDVDLTAMFGAKMEVGLQLRAEMTGIEMMKQRARVRAGVRNCRLCPLSQACNGPVPIHGPLEGITATVLVIGEAPGQQEDKKGVPFVGPAGKLLRAMMNGAGFDLDQVAFANTVSCWPTREPPTPKFEEMKACRGNLRDQIVASGALYVLLVGGIATQSWRSDLKVSDVHGSVFLWGKTWVIMPIYHPAAILRDQTKKNPTIKDLEKFHRIVSQGQVLEALETRCVKCGDGVEHYDPDGVAWCERHWFRYGAQWKEEWGRWSNEKVRVKVKRRGKKAVELIEGQGTMV